MCREQPGLVRDFLMATAMGYLWMLHHPADAAAMLIEPADPRQQDLNLIAVHQRAAAVVHASVAATASVGLTTSFYTYCTQTLDRTQSAYCTHTLWYVEPADPWQDINLIAVYQRAAAMVHAAVAGPSVGEDDFFIFDFYQF